DTVLRALHYVPTRRSSDLMGPGVVGTASSLGTSAVEVAGIVDAADRMGARVALCARVSGADPRDRHRGVSHHVRTILGLAAVRRSEEHTSELQSRENLVCR